MAKSKSSEVALVKEIREVVFRFLEGENEGVEIRVNPPRELFVGRSEECDIFLGEKKISRKHARISVSTKEVRLTDLQSTNGTFLNSKKVSEITLKNEDQVRFGTSVIQISVSSEASLGTDRPSDSVRGVKEEEEPQTGQLDVEPLHEESMTHDPSGVMDIPSSELFSPEEEGSDGVYESIDEELPPLPEPSAPSKSKNLSGSLSAMGLADLLQNLAQNQKSGLLVLKSSKEGKIWIGSGKILQAQIGTVNGPKAVYRMLSWNEGTFELLPLPSNFNSSKTDKPMNDSIEALLMEGFRQYDEYEKVKKGLPSLSARLRMKPNFNAPLSKLHPRVLDVLQVVLNHEKFEKVLDHSSLSDLETAKVVFYLIKKEYLVAD